MSTAPVNPIPIPIPTGGESTARPAHWRVRNGAIALSRPIVMGILNVTPDSFSDGGRHADPDAAIAHALAMAEQGADILDIGGESTRPGAEPVSEAEQIRRVVPVIDALARRLGETCVRISIDTTRSRVAHAAIDAGAAIVNDVSGGADDPSILSCVATCGAGLVLMHRRTRAVDDRYSDRHDSPPAYVDVVRDVLAVLLERRESALRAGVSMEAIAIDPGLGFGKDVEQNLQLMASVAMLVEAHSPILVGASRKSFIGAVAARTTTGSPSPAERLPGSLAAAVLCRAGGASIFRVHDVAETRQALDVAEAILRKRGRPTEGPVAAPDRPTLGSPE